MNIEQSVNGSSFTDKLQEAKSANMSEVDAYTEHLRSKYGNVSARSVGKDQASLTYTIPTLI